MIASFHILSNRIFILLESQEATYSELMAASLQINKIKKCILYVVGHYFLKLFSLPYTRFTILFLSPSILLNPVKLSLFVIACCNMWHYMLLLSGDHNGPQSLKINNIIHCKF